MPSAIILAGGLGTRLKAAVPDLPKPMAPVNGRPFLEHLFDYWLAQGIDRFVVSAGYKHETILRHFGNRYKSAALSYAVEAQPLGTGGGLLMALELIDDTAPVLVCNGDTFFEVKLNDLASLHSRQGDDLTVALFRTSDSLRYMGVSVDSDMAIRGFDSHQQPAEVLANGGVYLMRRSLLDGLQLRGATRYSLENDLFPRLLENGSRIHGLLCEGRFIDIGIPQDYTRAASVLTTGAI